MADSDFCWAHDPTNAEAHITQLNGAPWTGSRDQVDMNVGDCITLQLLVKFRTNIPRSVLFPPVKTSPRIP